MSNVCYVLELKWTLQFTVTIILATAVFGAAIGRSLVSTLSAVLAGYTVYTTILLLGLKPLSWIIFANLANLMDRFALLFAGAYTVATISDASNIPLRLGILVIGLHSLILAAILHGHVGPLPLLALMLLIASCILHSHRRFSILVSLAALATLAIFYWSGLQLLLVSTAIGFATIASIGQKTGRKSAVLLLLSIALLALYLVLVLQPYTPNSPLLWATILMLAWSLIDVVRRTFARNTEFIESAAIILIAALFEVIIPIVPSNAIEMMAAFSPFTLAALVALAQKRASSKRANFKTTIIVITLILIVYTPAIAIADSQLQSVLAKHCTKCHNGVIASTIEEMVANIRAWASEYKSLDEAVEKLYGYKSFRDYVAYMVKLTSLPSDYTESLADHFENIFSEAKKALEAPKTIIISVDSLTRRFAIPALILTVTTSCCVAFLYRRWSTSS